MGPFRKSSKISSLAVICLAALPVLAIEVPAGTAVSVRLKSKLSSNASKPRDPVEAVVIAPVMAGSQIAIPAGAVVRGIVLETKPAAGGQDRALLSIEFARLEMDGRNQPLFAKVLSVDNARETVNDSGQILGILGSESISARIDQGIGKVAEKYSGFAGVLQQAKGAMLQATEAEIAYGPGVEMQLALTKPLTVAQAHAGPELAPIPDEAELVELVAKQPFQTVAENPPKPSDITNLMYIGSKEQLDRAFQQAGWSTAAALSAQSKLETFRAIAESRGYKEAPVSILLLGGKPPELVYQKQNNTFAMRHHLRIWRSADTFHDQAVWLCAATHDTGIEFSPENRTFIHKIDSNIDRERAKVVSDLLFTGLVKSLALVDRPQVPRNGKNATGDSLETDGHMAVVILK